MGQKLASSVSLACENQPEVIIPLHAERWSKIEKVPVVLRNFEKNKGCFDPLVVSIGPYHHGKPELELMQQHRETMARQCASGELIQRVSPLVKDAKECYTDAKAVAKFSDEEFFQMMVLDACFIVEFIDCIVNGKSEALKMKSSMIAFVQRDLLLLENQIPFKVLNEVLGVKFEDETKKMEMLHKFVIKIRNLPHRKGTNKTTIKTFLSYLPFSGIKCAQDGNNIAKQVDGNDETKPVDGEPAHLLDVMRNNLIDKSARTKNSQGNDNGSYWFSYRSAKELKAVGIHFRPSKTDKFTDVDFQSKYYFGGYLNLPKICIDDSTKSMLLNMVAHECSTYGPDDPGVSSYICFMGSLVDHAEDVMELRKKGILLNLLRSDQQVADLINDTADNLVAHTRAYETVKHRIEEHYKNRVKIWLAEWLHTHFSSPWTFLAFIGAILALALTVIQTYESIKHSNR